MFRLVLRLVPICQISGPGSWTNYGLSNTYEYCQHSVACYALCRFPVTLGLSIRLHVTQYSPYGR